MGIRRYSNARRKALQCPLGGAVAPNRPNSDAADAIHFAIGRAARSVMTVISGSSKKRMGKPAHCPTPGVT